MPNTKSAIKRMKSDAKKRDNNQAVLSEIKTLKKKFKVLVQENKNDESKKAAQTLTAKLDKAVKNGTIPKTRADRNKSRIQLAINKTAKA